MRQTDLKIHPIADLFPMMTEEELQYLAADIKANGLVHPIIVDDENQIVDGRNRNAACKIAGVEPTFDKLNGRDPLDYIVSVNLARRNLTKGQQAMALAMIYPEGERGRGRNAEARKAKETLGFSSQRLMQARSILRYSRPMAESVLKGVISFDEALEMIRQQQQRAESAEARLQSLKTEAPELAARVDDENLTLDEAMAIHAQNKARIQDLKLSAQAALEDIGGFVHKVEVIRAGIRVGADLDFEPNLMKKMSEAWTSFVDLAKATGKGKK
jgi:hypothetical protein